MTPRPAARSICERICSVPWVLLAFALLIPTSLKAADEPLECRWTDKPLSLKLDADRAIWQQAKFIDNFLVPGVGPGRTPKTSTKAKLLWDREYLYFYAEMEDHDLLVKVREHQGMVWTSDVFELFFKPADGKPAYYEFEVNPVNATLELAFPERDPNAFVRVRDNTHIDFKTVVKVDGTINNPADDDKGWSVEGRIPWKDLAMTGGRPNPGEIWKLNLCRMDYTTGQPRQELSSCAPLTKSEFHRWEDYTPLLFVGPEHAAKRTPLTTSHVVGFPDPPLPYTAVKAFPNLHVERPLYILEEPGTNNFLLLQHLQYWAGPSRLLRFINSPSVDHADVVLDIDRLVYGMTLHPDFLHNGYIYLIGNGPVEAAVHQDRISRYTIDRKTGKIDPASELVILEWDSNGHDGGDLSFGPDGYLYHAAGDGTADSDKNLRGQDITHLNSAMIRIDVDHPSNGKPYSIPQDNPFVNTPGARPEVWAYGFRNPWRLAFDKQTGQLWVGQNGQDAWESVILVHRAENYGWSVYEGGHPFNLTRTRGPTPIVPPIIDHPHSEMRSLTGGVVYHGSKLPDLDGAFIYGDWSTGRIWGAKAPNDKLTWHHELMRSAMQIVGFRETSNGDLLVIDEGSGIYRIEKTPEGTTSPPFPRKLSETGLFASTKDQTPAPGLVPYEVNSPLWSDGATKQRFMAIPGSEPAEMTAIHGWNFPEGAVMVKTFSLPGPDGAPRRVETRLLTKQIGQWIGYSYIWNDEQTDATLVDAAGVDKPYAVHDASGDRTQTWHYPSRAECMTCHTRASNFVLGLSTLQLNRSITHDGKIENQLEYFQHQGMVQVDYATYLTGQAPPPPAANPAPRKMSPELPSDPAEIPHLVDPSDTSQSVGDRARSYLHANCAICHVKEGGGNALIDLEFQTPSDMMRAINQPPVHEKFDLPDARIIAAGAPDSSVLYHRMSIRGQGQMPPLATNRVDEKNLALLRQWIESMPK